MVEILLLSLPSSSSLPLTDDGWVSEVIQQCEKAGNSSAVRYVVAIGGAEPFADDTLFAYWTDLEAKLRGIASNDRIFLVPHWETQDHNKTKMEPILGLANRGVLHPSGAVWLKATPDAIFLSHTPNAELSVIKEFVNSQFNGQGFYSNLPFFVASATTAPRMDVLKLLQCELSFDKIWALHRAGWMESNSTGYTIGASFDGQDSATKLPTINASLLDVGDARLNPVGFFSKVFGSNTWVASHLNGKPNSVNATSDNESIAYTEQVRQIFEAIYPGGRLDGGNRLVLIRGLPGVGKKNLYRYLGCRTAGDGAPIAGWGDGSQVIRSVMCDIDVDEDYSRVEAKADQMSRAVSEISASTGRAHGLILFYDHVVEDPDVFAHVLSTENEALAGGEPTRIGLAAKLKLISKLCGMLRRAHCPQNLSIVFFSSSLNFDATSLMTLYGGTFVDFRMPGSHSVLKEIHRRHAAFVPIGLRDLEVGLGGFSGFCDKLLLSARSLFAVNPDCVGDPKTASRKLISECKQKMPWLKSESNWLQHCLSKFVFGIGADIKLVDLLRNRSHDFSSFVDAGGAFLAADEVVGQDFLLHELVGLGVVETASSQGHPYRIVSPLAFADE